MSGAVLHDDKSRIALTIGLPLASREEDDTLALADLDPLLEAPTHAAALCRVLAEFGYAEGRRPDSATEPGEEIRKAVTSTGTELLVVHVVAHGRLAETGQCDLHVVGSDGQDLDDPVSAWISLIESHPDKLRPMTLFVLDLCHAGAAATLPWHQEMRVGKRRAWVIAACGRQDTAFDYRLSRATTQVLRGYLDETLRVDASLAHIPLPTVAREIDRAVAELNAAADDFPQEIEASRIPFFTEHVDRLPFFPNPGHRSDDETALSHVDPDIATLLDEAFDPQHFMLRGAGTEALGRGVRQGYFHGRDEEVTALSTWLNGQGPGFHVVTGKPGVGKSALLGVLVCAAHPRLRRTTQNLWFRLPVKPARNERLTVVHARRRDLEQIADSVARQLGATERDRPGSGWDTGSLLALAEAAPGAPYTLVVDALDEAERPEDITQGLLLPLARTALTAGAPLRLLVGTRPDPHLSHLVQLAEDKGGLLDLDRARPADVHQALRQYIGDLLALDTPYAEVDAAEAATALAEGIATRLTGVDGDGQDRPGTVPLGWGEFLVAGLYLRHVLTLPTRLDPAAARELGLAAPVDLHELLELDLARHTEQPYLRPLLAALAHAEGRGMPERVLGHVTPEFVPTAPDAPLPITDVRVALAQARFYLRRDVDVDGTTLYRLFHEGLAERLRASPYGSAEQERTP
ncbi:hypothetical protein [Streptomyces sp. NPDC058718]|uniref:nSTAND1 domain-containing NTPase n=1 Tax=Streptomyces sp. NPDC058718 TaxID=3346610 RepID=UPI003699EEC2